MIRFKHLLQQRLLLTGTLPQVPPEISSPAGNPNHDGLKEWPLHLQVTSTSTLCVTVFIIYFLIRLHCQQSRRHVSHKAVMLCFPPLRLEDHRSPMECSQLCCFPLKNTRVHQVERNTGLRATNRLTTSVCMCMPRVPSAV